jgi:DNA-binding XRE family transcriptional regulator|tara:strand:+ start:1870 stop:2142 length:273 start_codon:yes stop_codon:yes gene_type:complete
MDTYYSPSISEVKNHRLRCNLTQKQAAELVCVTQVTWSRWEKGICTMPAGLWKLFLIMIKPTDEVNEVNKDIPRTTLQSLTDTWDEENSV